MMRTANPALNANTFEGLEHLLSSSGAETKKMTIYGSAHKTVVLLVLVVITASFTWNKFYVNGGAAGGGFAAVKPWFYGGLIGGLIFALITIFGNKKWAIVTGPCYALLQGLFLGGISAMFEARFPGIVIQAVGLTFGVTLSLLLAYVSRLIKATENFKLGMSAALGGIFMIYAATWILRMFGTSIPFIHDSGMIGIGFSLFVVIIAALTLVLSFDFIEEGAARGAPKYMEWYAAFGLMFTLVWLYVEILILLSKLRGGSD